jgi:hypothetical protein
VGQNELQTGSSPRGKVTTLEVIRRAFESAGVAFIEENGGGAGVRLKKASDLELKNRKPK